MQKLLEEMPERKSIEAQLKKLEQGYTADIQAAIKELQARADKYQKEAAIEAAQQTEKQLILLVDDIFAELDENNIILFLNIIIQHQIILTSQKSLPEGINHEKFTCINLVNS